MYVDPADGLPLVGSHKRSLLGVRANGAHADVDANPPGDLNGIVAVNRKGLSVSADWRSLPGHLIPEELDDGLNGASGKGMEVYVHGSGSFSEGAVTSNLELLMKANNLDSGFVSPILAVPLSQYQADLQATRLQWVIDPS